MKQSLITQRQKLTRARVRAKISGTKKRPRLSVYISNVHVTAQLIDDQNAVTLVYASTIGNPKLQGNTMTQKAQWVGKEIAESAKKDKITHVVFDRGYKKYHGRTKALADSARSAGLTF